MELSHSDLVVLFVLVVAATGPARARAADRRAVPDPARPRRAGARADPRHPGDRAPARGRARRHPAAAALLGGVLHLAARPAGQHRARSACSRSGWSSSPSPSVAVVAHAVLDLGWPAAFALGAVVSPTDPIAATSIAQPPRPPAPHRRDRRGREPGQRRHRARGLQVRDRGDGRRHGQPARALGCPSSGRSAGGIAHRPRRRLGAARGAAAPEQPAGRDHDRARHGLDRLRAGRARRRLGRARRRHRRRLRRLVHARADDGRDAAAGRRVLVDPHVRPQRAAVHPRRAAGAGDPRRAEPERPQRADPAGAADPAGR